MEIFPVESCKIRTATLHTTRLYIYITIDKEKRKLKTKAGRKHKKAKKTNFLKKGQLIKMVGHLPIYLYLYLTGFWNNARELPKKRTADRYHSKKQFNEEVYFCLSLKRMRQKSTQDKVNVSRKLFLYTNSTFARR